MTQLDYAASLIMDELLDVESKGGADALSAFSDYSNEAKPGQSVTIPELGSLTVSTTGGNAISAQALPVSTNKMIIDQPAMIPIYVDRIEDLVGTNGGMAQKVAVAAMRALREHVAGDILAQARSVLVGAGDAGLVANVGADTLTDADINSIEGLLCAQAGVSAATEISLVGSPGMSAAIKSTLNYAQKDASGSVGQGALFSVNGRPYYQTSHLDSKVGDNTVATTASTISSNIGTQTVASGHGIIRGQLVTTTGLTANASTATVVTQTSATSVACAITAGDGAQADGVGSVLSASSLGLMFVKPWACYGIANGVFDVFIVKSPTGLGWVVQVGCIYGTKIRAGGVAAIHAPVLA